MIGFLLFIPFESIFAQNGVGIATTTISNGAIFEIGDNWGGLLIPRVALNNFTDSTTIPGLITNGTLVYHTNPSTVPEGFYYWQTDQWIPLTTPTINLYNSHGVLDDNRVLNQGNYELELTGNAGKSAFTVRRTNNSIEQGISFMNKNGEYTASIFMDTPQQTKLKIATGGRSSNLGSLTTTLSLGDDQAIEFNNYGKSSHTGSPSQILGVDLNGLVLEKPFNSVTDNIYTTNGGLNSPRTINTNDRILSFRNTANRDMRILPANPADNDSPFVFFTNNAYDFRIKDFNALQITAGSKIIAERYGLGNIKGKPTFKLGVEEGGKIIELNVPSDGVQFYSYIFPREPSPDMVDIETNSVVQQSGFYTGLLDYNNGNPVGFRPREDGFIIKMVGTYEVKNAGTFAISSNSDDGARVYVDDALILDAWVDSANVRGDGSVSLSKGKHKFSFYFYENGGGDFFQFRWEGTTPDGLSGIMLGSQFTIE